MLLLILAGLLGIWRFRSKAYWRWLGVLTAWMLVMQTLFYAGGTLEDPSGDGYLTRYIRIATHDGAGMGVFAIAFVIIYWGVSIYLLREMWKAGKESEQRSLVDYEDAPETASVGRKSAETAGLLVAAAGWVYFAFVMPQLGLEQSGQLSDQQAVTPVENAVAPDPIAAQLQRTVLEANASLPKTIDPVTRLDRTSAEGRTITYHYTITRRDASDADFRAFIEKNTIPKVCADTRMVPELRDYGITYRYSYTMPNQSQLIEVDVNWSKCKSD